MLQKKEQLELERQILNKTDLLIETLIETSMLVGDERDKKLDTSIRIVFDMAVLLKEYLGGHPEHFETLLHELTRQKLPDDNVLKSFGDFNTCLDNAIIKGLELYRNSAYEASEAENTIEESPVNWEDESSEDLVEEIAVETNVVVDYPNVTEEATEDEPDIADNLEAPALMAEVIVETFQEESLSTDMTEKARDPMGESEEPVEVPDTQFDEPQEPLLPENAETGAIQDYWDLALKQVFPDTSITKEYNHKGITFSYFLPEKSIAIDIAPKDKRQAVWKEFYCKQEQIKLLSIPALENPRPRQIVRTLKRSLAQNAGLFS